MLKATKTSACICLLAGTFLSLSLPLGDARADADAERGSLAQVVHELDGLDPLLQAAASHAEPDARIRFQYDWLRQDLARIRLGIQDHLNAPLAEPRRYPPVRGDYRR